MGAMEISFINIMEVSLIRKKILDYIPSFKDIYCIASTCCGLNQIIKNEKVTRKITFEFFDKIDVIFAKIDDVIRYIGEHIDFEEESIFQDCAFLENFNFNDSGENEEEKLNGDIFVCDNIVKISFTNMTRELSSQEYLSFISTLSQQYKINLEERKDSTILKLRDKERSGNCLPLLHVLSYLYHENINTIIIPVNFFSIDITKHSDMLNNLFDGFPKLYKLGIHSSFSYNTNHNFSHNKKIIDKIMRQLSKKKYATIHMICFHGHNPRTVDYFLVFFEIALRYGIKVIMDETTLLQLKKRNISEILWHMNYPIEQCVTQCVGKIGFLNSNLHDCFRRIRRYENLVIVTLIFNNCVCDSLLEEEFKASGSIQSLKNLKHVIALELIFAEHSSKLSKDKLEILHRNVKYLFLLLPESIKSLRLYGIPRLNYGITSAIERNMPNIEVLSLYNVSFEVNDCLSVFKKLQVLTINDNIPTKIPDNVKFFVIHTTESIEKDVNQRLINKYSKKFSKRLMDNNGRIIFFDDVIDFRRYKNLIQIVNIIQKYKNYFRLT
uniref:TIR domain-containing protein n=1 Tax=Strongyloides venezuelensis TaxID=75913 RepID=A0A0K0EYY0_STRVS